MEPATPKNNWHYNIKLKPLARRLRKEGTKAEACLWKFILSKKQLAGYTFLRQRPILNYIADFMCKELMLVIEVDGLTHHFDEVAEKDRRKQDALEEIGFTVIRFDDEQVLNEIEQVNTILMNWIGAFEANGSSP